MVQKQDDEALQDILIDENLDKIKNKIVVISGKGGVGKSTVSVNLAYALLLEGKRVGIMDVDIHGPSVARMTGIEGQALTVANTNQRPAPIEVVNQLYVLSIASMLKNSDDPVVWRGPMKMNMIKQFLSDIEWPELDFLIVDCPPGTGDEPLSVIQILKNVTGSIIVSTPQDVAFLDARKTINFSKMLKVPVLGLIENMAGFVCPNCGEKVDIFSAGGAAKAAKDFQLKILGHIPIDTDIVESGDSGQSYVYHYGKKEGAAIYRTIARGVLEDPLVIK